MSLSSELISQFVKATKDNTKTKTETIVYGTVVYNGKPYVKIDGSELLTPVTTTASVNDGERVTVMIKDHTATVTGNISSPSASTGDVKEVSADVSEFKNVMAYKVTTQDLQAANATIENLKATLASIMHLDVVSADIENLQAKFAELEYVGADEIKAITADIESLQAKFGEFTDISTDELTALNADIDILKGYTANFTYVSAEVLDAVKANIRELNVKKLSVEDANIKFATIENLKVTNQNVENLTADHGEFKDVTTEKLDAAEASIDLLDVNKLNAAEAKTLYLSSDFASISKSKFEEFFAQAGILTEITVGEANITGKLVGVEIHGDLIKGGTIQADRLIVKDDKTGLYYRLNFESGAFTNAEEVPTDSLHGSVITAESITADKIKVTDLEAFGATIGGFEISQKSIHSYLKETADNTMRGIYMDSEGQLSIGDGDTYVKYYKAMRIGASIQNILPTKVIFKAVDTTESDRYRCSIVEDQVAIEGGDNVEISYKDGMLYVSDVTWKLDIAADNVSFDFDANPAFNDMKNLTDKIRISTRYNSDIGKFEPCIELSEDDNNFKMILTNKNAKFIDGENESTEIDSDGIRTENITVVNDFKQGDFMWSQRENGNYGLIWKGVSS